MLDLLAQLRAHAREARPAECCGLVLVRTRPERLPIVSVRRGRNRIAEAARDGLAARGRSVRDGFFLDPADLLAALRECEREGAELRIAAVYHSHPDGPAALSALDRRPPALAGTGQIVIGASGEVALFAWREERGAYERRGFDLLEEALASLRPDVG